MKIGTFPAIFLFIIIKQVTGFHRVCYYTNWSQYRPDGGQFTPDHVNPALCSHIIYAFAKLDGTKLKAFEWNDESTPLTIGMYAQINNMKKLHPHLKTLLAVGGWNAGSAGFSNMALTAASRQQFVNHTQHFLRERNFDGLDIDWEYPTQRGGRPEDKRNLVLLLKDLATAFEQDAYHTGRPKLLLSAAVPASRKHIESGFDIPNIARSLDLINVMTYDLHGSWEVTTGHNSPLFQRASETGNETQMNTKWALSHWARMGAPKHKLMVGLGLYGRSFKLENPINNGVGAMAIGAGRMGNYTKEEGFMAFYEVCQEMTKGAVRVWDAEQKVPYIHNGDLWVGYDDEQSIREKVQWAKQEGYGGMMMWSMALDDFSGNICKRGQHPLLTAVNNEVKRTALPQTIQFIDPTVSGGGIVSLDGLPATPPTAILTNPPLAQAFEHRSADGHSHHLQSQPILTNLSGIDLQQLSSLPHISIIDHHPGGAPHSSAIKTTPQPTSGGQIGISGQPQTSLADLINQLIHAPASHLSSGHHNQNTGLNLPASVQPSPNPPPSGPILQDVLSGGAPPPGAVTISDTVNPLVIPNTLQGRQVHVGNPVPNLAVVEGPALGQASSPVVGQAHSPVPGPPLGLGHSPISGLAMGPGVGVASSPVISPALVAGPSPVLGPAPVPALRPLTALGSIGVIPAVGRLGGVGGRDRLRAIPSISFSSNKNSSSSSSTSSSQSNSRNVSIGIPNQPSGRLNLQDVLKSGRSSLPASLLGGNGHLPPSDPLIRLTQDAAIPADAIFSVLDGNVPTSQRFELPSGSVGEVIPISNNDNLAQVLSSLGVELPTAGSVLLPEEPRVLSPNRVLDELALGNILQPQTLSNVQPLPTIGNTLQPLRNDRMQQRRAIGNPVQRQSLDALQLRRAIRDALQSQAVNGRQQSRSMRNSPPAQRRVRLPALRQRPVMTRRPITAPRSSISRRQTIPRTLDSLSTNRLSPRRQARNVVQPTSLTRPSTSQRRRISIAELERLLQRRRTEQALRSPQPTHRNRIPDTRTLQTRRSRVQQPPLSQQRLIQPSVTRRRLQRVPASQLGLRRQPDRRRTVTQTRRPVQSLSTGGLTFLNSGNLPPRLRRRILTGSQTSSLPLSQLI